MRSAPFGPMDPALYRETVRRALAEDLGWGDLTTEAAIPTDLRSRGVVSARTACVLAGLDVAAETFRQLDPGLSIVAHHQDGDWCQPGERIADLSGYAAALLTAERTALNFLQHLSGIATLTRQFVDASGGKIGVVDTRKTLPTLRVLEKYAVRAGGGINRRMALDEGLLIKQNHAGLVGGLTEAFRRVRAAGHELPIEVEANTLEEVREALEAGATFIMLSGMGSDAVREAVRSSRGRAKVEISGRFTPQEVAELAGSGADYIAVGVLTQSAPAADLGFEIQPEPARDRTSRG